MTRKSLDCQVHTIYCEASASGLRTLRPQTRARVCKHARLMDEQVVIPLDIPLLEQDADGGAACGPSGQA